MPLAIVPWIRFRVRLVMFGNKCHLSVVREEHRAVENGMAQCTVQQTKQDRQVEWATINNTVKLLLPLSTIWLWTHVCMLKQLCTLIVWSWQPSPRKQQVWFTKCARSGQAYVRLSHAVPCYSQTSTYHRKPSISSRVKYLQWIRD